MANANKEKKSSISEEGLKFIIYKEFLQINKRSVSQRIVDKEQDSAVSQRNNTNC